MEPSNKVATIDPSPDEGLAESAKSASASDSTTLLISPLVEPPHAHVLCRVIKVLDGVSEADEDVDAAHG
jgi:hypothetical protein